MLKGYWGDIVARLNYSDPDIVLFSCCQNAMPHRHVLQLGLGAGVVASYLRSHRIQASLLLCEYWLHVIGGLVLMSG